MKVRQMLERKAITAVETIAQDRTLGDAANRLSELRIGCLVIEGEGGGLGGILSERDIVRVLGEQGPSCLSNPVSSAMTREVKVCAPDDDAMSLLTRMTAGRFRHLPVMDGEKLVGLISIGDAVSARIANLERENEALEDMIRSATA